MPPPPHFLVQDDHHAHLLKRQRVLQMYTPPLSNSKLSQGFLSALIVRLSLPFPRTSSPHPENSLVHGSQRSKEVARKSPALETAQEL